jgi:HSP20 family protein
VYSLVHPSLDAAIDMLAFNMRGGGFMALARWSPFRDLMSIRDEMNRLVNEYTGEGRAEGEMWHPGSWSPAVDIFETDDALVLKAELAGFSKEDVNVEIKDNTLLLRGFRKREAEVKEENYHRMERAYGAFQRSFLLPATIDQDKATASYKDGVLELRLPKAESFKPRRIAVTG